tara:strand:- start:559 stop:819 length:261 start_codon:yes stop_codon:yes gene_type:complete
MQKDLGTRFWKRKENYEHNLNKFDSHLLDQELTNKFLKNYEESFIAHFVRNKIVGFIKNDKSWHTVKKNKYDYDRRALVINVFEIY